MSKSTTIIGYYCYVHTVILTENFNRKMIFSCKLQNEVNPIIKLSYAVILKVNKKHKI